MAVEKSGAKTDVIVKLVLVFFVCLLSFSIGTFVGKKFSDNQHKVAKYEPESAGQERDIASVQPEAGEVKPNDALTDDEVAKLAEEFVTDEKEGVVKEEFGPKDDKNTETVQEAKEEERTPAAAPAHATVKHEKSPSRTTQSVSEEAASPAAEKVAHGEAPSHAEKTKATAKAGPAATLPKEVAGSTLGKYTVQVASYPTEEEAKKLSGSLKDQGFSAFYVATKIKDRKANTEKTWYRVSVGLFATQKEASTYKTELMARAKVGSAMVQKITE